MTYNEPLLQLVGQATSLVLANKTPESPTLDKTDLIYRNLSVYQAEGTEGEW